MVASYAKYFDADENDAGVDAIDSLPNKAEEIWSK